MRKLARPEHFASIDKLIEYARSGRFARALRMSFDVLEVLKIDIANRSIEMYREYMRSTAVAYERSHFCNMMRRNSVPVDETRVWWRMEYDALRGRFQSLDEIFSHVFRALVLGGDQPVPKLMHMDEARINGIRREYERLETVGFLFMGFTQFIQAIGRASASATGEPSGQQPEFRTENGRVDFERLGKECLKLVPEGYAINWSDSIGDSAAGDWRMPVGARGEVLVGVLVTQMVGLAGRVLGRKIQPTEVTQLWRAVRTVVQSGSPVRGIVAGRIKTTVEIHLSSLEASSTRFRGDAWEAMPEDAKLTLRRSMLGFLESVLASLAIKVHAIRAHHWLVYKSFYQALVSSSSLLSQPTVSIDKTPSESPASAVAAQPQAL
ncbi:cAMP-mediated signaling protein sok1, partial [Linderina macrospora]